jgi:hypothetical protein
MMGDGTSFPEMKRPWLGVDQPPSSSVEVKEKVHLILFSTSELPVARYVLILFLFF